MNFERIYPQKSKILKIFALYALVLLLLIYGIFSSRFGWAYQGEEMLVSCIVQDVACIVVWIVLCVISYFILNLDKEKFTGSNKLPIVLTKQNYYVILKEGIIHHKWTKEVRYEFKDILYIDEEYTEKHSTLLFYTSKGHAIYLVLDKEEKILKAVQNKSRNLISKQEYHNRFPNVSM